MKTHMSNTKALELGNDIVAKKAFINHQQHLHSNVKPVVVTKRKEQIKIVKNNKRQINQNPQQHVNQLNKNLHTNNKYKCSLDNQAPIHYELGKKILKDKIKKNKQENYAKNEHERQLRSQASRVKNCKTINQRKKDKTDPIVNPTYLLREGSAINSVTIDQYCKKILTKNRPASGVPSSSKMNFNFESGPAHFSENFQTNLALGNVPDLSKKRPQSAKTYGKQQYPNYSKKNEEDLPGCTFKEILNHIVDKKLFKDTQLKVLYVRLCHKYSEQEVDDIWEVLMDELEK